MAAELTAHEVLAGWLELAEEIRLEHDGVDGEHLKLVPDASSREEVQPLYGLERLRRVSAELAELAAPTVRPRLRLVQSGEDGGASSA